MSTSSSSPVFRRRRNRRKGGSSFIIVGKKSDPSLPPPSPSSGKSNKVSNNKSHKKGKRVVEQDPEDDEVGYYSAPASSSHSPGKGVRYVNIRVAIPADSPSIPEEQEFVDNVGSPLTVASNASRISPLPLSTASASPFHGSPAFRSTSPYGFVPIEEEYDNGYDFANGWDDEASFMDGSHNSFRMATPPPTSPYDFKSIRTETTRPETPTTVNSLDTTAIHSSGGSPAKARSLVTTPPPFKHPRSSPLPKGKQNHLSKYHREAPCPSTPNSVASSHGRKSPFSPVSGKDDVVRKTRIKTELCMHFSKGRPCPFGHNCTYAHGMEELQKTKLVDLHDAGLVDLDTYRTRPCFTWVATGSCPFGKRCTGIHDPRATGAYPSWLTHTETQGNSLETDVNVDSLHSKFFHVIHNGTPFGDQFSLEDDSWCDLYRKVCNLEYSGSPMRPVPPHAWMEKSTNSRRRLDPLVKLTIALLMRGDNPDWQYKFVPKHLIHGELCMVLQKRAFCIKNMSSSSKKKKKKNGKHNPECDEVNEIALKTFKASNQNHILVHELAFGPDSDSQVPRPVALWFDIDEKHITECNGAQAKRFRWKRGINKKDSDNDSVNSGNESLAGPGKASPFSGLENFVMIRPHDEVAYDFTTAILKHRLSVMSSERLPDMKKRFEALQQTDLTKTDLQQQFGNLRRSWIGWSWPINNGREVVTKKTPVPPVDGKYRLPPPPIPARCNDDIDDEDSVIAQTISFLDEVQDESAEDSTHPGSQLYRVWNAFVQNEILLPKTKVGGSPTSLEETTSPTTKRLRVFQDLEDGLPLTEDRSLPHIRSMYRMDNSASTDDDTLKYPCELTVLRQQERCWRALLLPTKEGETDDWGIIYDHFCNSRSKKVLNIIQQK